MTIATILHLGCAGVYVLLAALILLQAKRSRTGFLLAGVCAVTALWAASIAAFPLLRTVALPRDLDMVQSLAWYGFILHLFRRTVASGDTVVSDGKAADATSDGSEAGRLFRLIFWLALAALPVLAILGEMPATTALAGLGRVVFMLGLSIGKLLLLENLYLNTDAERRWRINLLCVAISGLAIYEILLTADAVLTRGVTPALVLGRPLIAAIVAPLLAIGAARNRDWAINIHVSRTAAFHSATLVISGIFLIGLAGAGEVLRNFRPGWGGVVEIAIVFGGLIGLMVLLSSGSARSAIRKLVVDHFFSHRFDYRSEWLRCIETLSAGEDVPLHVRVIRSLAQLVDSPGGVLFLRNNKSAVTVGAAFEWAGSWNMPAATQPIMQEHPLIAAFRGGVWVAERQKDAAPLMEEIPGAWLAIPLAHRGNLIGFVLVAPPRFSFTLDYEVFDLLRIVGGEVATYIAEQQAARVLMEMRQLHEYGKRFAFVAHDIKNVSSQLSLLLSNAEIHLQNPEFQSDMLATVRASVQKIGALLRRLQTPESGTGHSLVIPAERMTQIVASFRQTRGANLLIEQDGRSASVLMEPASFDAVVTHVLTNAIEASDGREPVRIRLRHETRRVLLDIIDTGPGMTPEFIRDALFQPFRTSKREGSGIGAFQARELLRGAGGDLLALSQPGQGTTMRILLLIDDAAVLAPVSDPAFAAEAAARDVVSQGVVSQGVVQ